jgi:hypothetical protein
MVYRGYTATGSGGLYRGLTGGAPQLVAGTGTVIPGVGTLLDVNSWTVNRTGTVAFQGTLTGGATGIFVSMALERSRELTRLCSREVTQG